MKNALILHGRPTKEIYYSPKFPSSSNFAWIPWLQKQLIINDIKTDTPEIPHSYEANYQSWKNEFENYSVDENTILIGHSAGAGFLIRWLSERKEITVTKIILVAPGFSLFEGNLDSIDPNLSERVKEIIVFVSDNDPGNSLPNTRRLQEKIKNIRVNELKGYGHFIPDHMGTDEFPELLDVIL
jgi:predicted alpha/beta hydrolase family esterase